MNPYLLHQLIERAPRDRACLGHQKVRVTYGELDAESDQIAALLQSHGVKPGDRVALYQTKSLRGVAELFAILKCGAAYVPIDPIAPPDRARFILEHCGVDVLFSAGRALKELGNDRKARVVFDSDALTLETRRFTAPSYLTDTDLAYVLYTSGSTGTPKGVAITHAQSLTFVRTATAAFELTEKDVLASHAPFNFDLSVIDLFCTFLAGGRMEIIPETWLAFPARVSKLIEEAGISVWNSVPSALMQLVSRGALEERNLKALRLIMFAGEPYPVKQLRALRDAVPHATLLNVYGQTEANSSTSYTITELPDDDGAVLPVGKTFPNYDVLLLDEQGRAVIEPGIEGELYVLGGAVASGYFNDPERTAKAFVQHPLQSGAREIAYKTGDRFMFDQNRDLVFRGRVDSAVKVRGFRVELGEIEAVLGSHDSIEEAALLAIPHAELGHALVAFVVAKKEQAPDDAALLAHVAAKLPRYMLPVAILKMRALPRTPNGKVDRKALLEPARQAALGPSP